jgi:DNA ligase-1
VLLSRVATTSQQVAATSARSSKTALIAAALREAEGDELPLAVSYLAGDLPQRRTGVGYASLRELPAPAGAPSLTLRAVDALVQQIADESGAGSQGRRKGLLDELFAAATADEQRLLVGLLSGELRQGALDGVMAEAIAAATSVPAAEVRRAVMLAGAAGPVASALAHSGVAGLDAFRLEVGRPVQPMLAQSAPDVGAALERLGTAALEWKLDGIRVQVHRRDDDVQVWTRSLDDITDRVPEVVETVRALDLRTVVLDGEAIALDDQARPLPFQQTASRTGSRVDVATARRRTPLTAFFFDVLHLDGADLLGLAAAERHEALARAVPEPQRVPRLVTSDVEAATAFFADAVRRGHEGVVAKSLDAPYEAGRRGAGWLKVKPRHTLDLVVLAAEWGHGRRRGWLSNLHLGARDPHGHYGEPGGFVMLGKTFKGLTDAMLRWQTERLQELALEPEASDWVVPVRPELVVEIAFDGVQTSPRYPAGMALRFARVLRHRPDKTAAEADTIDAVAAVHRGETTSPG